MIKAGDRVRILKGADTEHLYWSKAMDEFVGKETTVLDASDPHFIDLADYGHFAFESEWLELVTDKVAIGKIHLNEAGQISLQDTEGNMFDMSKYVGKTLYIEVE